MSKSIKPIFTPRPTKYRAWDGSKMIAVQTLCWSPGGMIWYGGGNTNGWGWINPACTTWSKDNPKPSDADVCPLMEWTGAFDSKGVEIYEGDIVMYPMWEGVEKGYRDSPMEVTWSIGESQWSVRDIETEDENPYGFHEWDTTMVIGNVFENPNPIKT